MYNYRKYIIYKKIYNICKIHIDDLLVKIYTDIIYNRYCRFIALYINV